MKRWFAWGLMGVMAAGRMGCETMKGLGRDISKAGESIEVAAK